MSGSTNCSTSIPQTTTQQINDTWIHAKPWMNLQIIMLNKKVNLEGYLLYDSIYITFFIRQNYRNEDVINVYRLQYKGVKWEESDVT